MKDRAEHATQQKKMKERKYHYQKESLTSCLGEVRCQSLRFQVLTKMNVFASLKAQARNLLRTYTL